LNAGAVSSRNGLAGGGISGGAETIESHKTRRDNRRSHRILIVDGEEPLCGSCRQALEAQGLDVAVAGGGQCGVQEVEAIQPDVILLNLDLPGGRGVTLLEELQKSHPERMVIVIADGPSVETSIEAMKGGAYDFLPHPFTPQELRERVMRAIERRVLIQKRGVIEEERRTIQNNFIAMVSHQMKTPLVAIAECIEVLAKGLAGNLTGEQESLVKRVSARIQHLLHLVENFLRLSRFEATGKLESLKDVRLREVAVGAWTSILAECKQKTLNFVLQESETKEDATTVQGDELLLHEVFVNLFSNSAQYTPSNGDVVLEFLPRSHGCITLKVSDTGVGIPPEEQPFIFDEFFRGASATGANTIPGTGLGLAIVKRIMEAHGGTITMESVPGRGTTCTLKFPVA